MWVDTNQVKSKKKKKNPNTIPISKVSIIYKQVLVATNFSPCGESIIKKKLIKALTQNLHNISTFLAIIKILNLHSQYNLLNNLTLKAHKSYV